MDSNEDPITLLGNMPIILSLPAHASGIASANLKSEAVPRLPVSAIMIVVAKLDHA